MVDDTRNEISAQTGSDLYDYNVYTVTTEVAFCGIHAVQMV